MTKILLPLLIAASLSPAWRLSPLPTPMRENGVVVHFDAAAVMDDSTLVGRDSGNGSRFWWSRDWGRHWDSIPAMDASLFGRSVVTSGLGKIWTQSGGWQEISMPSVCRAGAEGVASIDGWVARLSPQSDSIQYCRSLDGMRTWTRWIALAKSQVRPEFGFYFGEVFLDRVWYAIRDSGYIRGTSDGMRWTKIAAPSGWTEFVLINSNPDICLYSYAQGGETGRFATTRDTGRTWTIRSTLQPGGWNRKLGPNLWSSQTFDASVPGSTNHWLATSADGPWEKMAAYDAGDRIFNDGDTPYLLKASGLQRLDPGDVSIEPRTRTHPMKANHKSNYVVLDLDHSMSGSSWTQVGLDGRIVASGVLKGPRLELALRPGATLLRVGTSSLKLPPL